MNTKNFFWKDKVLSLKDGIKLISRIWLPEGKGPWPALLMRQPYGRRIASTVTYHHPSWWAKNGYLVVIQDVRGQGDSEGVFKGFEQEASDTSETLEWVRSLDECNGRLGTYGFSYQGLTQLLAKKGTKPPDCLAPAMTGLNERDHWSCEGGAHWWHLGIAWGIQLAALQASRKGNEKCWKSLRKSLDSGNYLLDGYELLEKYDPDGMAISWLKRTSKSNKDWPIHKPLDSWLKSPMLLIGGWWDPHLKGILDLFAQSVNAGGSPELHIGPATHLKWWPEAQKLHLNFFNRNLKTKPHTQKLSTTPYLQIWNLSTNKWSSSEFFKSHKNDNSSSIKYWGLKSEGTACLDTKEGLLLPNTKGSGEVHIVNDPWRPVPAIGGHLGIQPGPAERSELDLRSDVATFTSDPFDQDLRLEGFPCLEIKASSDQEGFDICVAFSKIDREQKNTSQLSTGMLRIEGQQVMKTFKHEITLQPLFCDIKCEERLRISISGSAWPAIGVNPGNNHKPIGAPGPHCLTITMAIDLNESRIHFKPLIPQKALQGHHEEA